jgi:hypothetical protein
MGARKFGIINVGPVGCVPQVRVLNAKGACNDALNRYAAGFARVVKSGLADLAPKLPGLAYSLADSFASSQGSFDNPKSTGMCFLHVLESILDTMVILFCVEFVLPAVNFSNYVLDVGLVNSDNACCGSGRLGAEGPCVRNATLCTNRDMYMFWDSVHPTQRAAELGAEGLFDGPAQLTSPISFKQLSHKRY